MLPDKILQSDLLDILFENRNKTYGAYALRKSYNKTVKAAITTTVLMSTCFALIILMHHNKEVYLVKTLDLTPDPTLSSFKPVNPKPPQSIQIKHVNNFRQVNTSPPVIVSDTIKSTQPTIDEIDKSSIGAIAKTGDDTNDKTEQPPSDNRGGKQNISIKDEVAINNDAPLITAEVMPEFPGGINALIKFIQKNIKQPDDLEAAEKIQVVASFVVSKTGGIEDVKIISGGREDLDKEVLKVINKMPVWKPGMQNGKPVSVYFKLPVTFKSADD